MDIIYMILYLNFKLEECKINEEKSVSEWMNEEHECNDKINRILNDKVLILFDWNIWIYMCIQIDSIQFLI